MCELLVRVVDKINDDFYKNCECTKRGDVIVGKEDGWAWGKEELANPDWRIVALPGVPLSHVMALLQYELQVDPNHRSRTTQKRAFKLDLDALVAPASRGNTHASAMADAKRVTPVVQIDLSPEEITPLILAKPAIHDPAIIGNFRPLGVIG